MRCPKCVLIFQKHKLEVWPGYVTAIDNYEGGLKLMLDVTHRVIRNENVRDVLMSFKVNFQSFCFNNNFDFSGSIKPFTKMFS